MPTEDTGGADWEIGAAAGALTNTWLAWSAEPTAARFAAYEEAARRHAAAVTSKSTSALASIMASVLHSQAELRTLFERMEHAELVWRGELRSHLDARFDAFGAELDAFKLESRAQHTKSNADRAELRDTIGALAESMETLARELEDVRARSLADAVDPSERLRLIQWLRDNQTALARIIERYGDEQ